jgi:chromate reductase, NAD(P)H dehydrogenase (quinone)
MAWRWSFEHKSHARHQHTGVKPTVNEAITVAAFAGSLRRTSHNRGLLRLAAEVAPPAMNIKIIDLAPLPLYNGELDLAWPNKPQPVVDFINALDAADALLIATPEYNYSISGVLKNALDWASRRPGADRDPAIQGKPAAIMGAGGRFGTVRAQMHLRYILLHNDVKVMNKPEVMIVRSGEAADSEGNIIDPAVRSQVSDLVDALYQWTFQLRPALV